MTNIQKMHRRFEPWLRDLTFGFMQVRPTRSLGLNTYLNARIICKLLEILAFMKIRGATTCPETTIYARIRTKHQLREREGLYCVFQVQKGATINLFYKLYLCKKLKGGLITLQPPPSLIYANARHTSPTDITPVVYGT